MVSKLQISDLLSNGDKLWEFLDLASYVLSFSGCTEDNLSPQLSVTFQIKKSVSTWNKRTGLENKLFSLLLGDIEIEI